VAWARFVAASLAFAVLERAAGLGAARVRPAAEVAGPAPPEGGEVTPAAGPAPGRAAYAVLGLTGIFAYNVFFFYGLTLATATESSLIIASSPVVVALLGLVFLGERLAPVRAAGVLVSTAGVVLVVLGAATAPARGSGAEGRLLGNLLMLGGVLSWAVYSAVGRRVLVHVNPFRATSLAVYWGTVFLTLAVLLRPGGLPILAATAGRVDLTAAAGLLYLSLVSTVFGFVAWYRGVQAVGVSGAAAYLNLVPLSTLAIAAVALGEGLTWVQAAGGAMVLGGVYLVGGGSRRRLSRGGVRGAVRPPRPRAARS
jgi:drug/metabolite transporter (DMT)-like permease